MVTKTCECCGSVYETSHPRRSRFCSRRCLDRVRTPPSRSVPCAECGVLGRKTSRTSGLCITCFNSQHSGSQNPNWKGGSRQWSAGRRGRDRDGLSWKSQQKLAWERDGYKCTRCGTKPHRNPDVHHKVPYRISQSHALDNLECLCSTCHMQVEATVQEVWGGQLVTHPELLVPKKHCTVCGKHHKYPKDLCKTCWRTWVVQQTLRLQETGMKIRDIADALGVERTNLYHFMQRARATNGERVVSVA